MSKILGIESSCDDTSAAVCIDGQIVANNTSTQQIHEKYGGVVPELASRAHHKNILPVVDFVLKKSNLQLNELDAIAYTQGPGLLGALLVGSSFAKALACSLDIPLLPVHHMKAHVLAHFIDEPKPKFPFLCLTVSGGHTQLLKVINDVEMIILGQTIDDAVGEAFDKSAKLMGLPYPGGPLIDKYAQDGEVKFSFSGSNVGDLDYSFSGIKTSILYFLQKQIKVNPDFIQENLADLCASIQYQLIEMLFDKLIKSTKQTGLNQIAIAGGVSANSELRKRLKIEAKKRNWEVFIPNFQYCTDNAGMIAMAGHFKYERKEYGNLTDSPLPRMAF